MSDHPPLPPDSRRLRIVLADDHRLLRQGLRGLLQAAECEVVADCGTGPEALSAIGSLLPDVALLDHSMPGMTGLDVTRAVKNGGLSVPCVLLSSFNDPLLVAESIRCGARGYLLKDDAFEEIAEAMRVVSTGGTYFSAALDVIKLREALNVLAITSREADVLALLVKGASAREIANELGISHRTVETYRDQLVAKFGARNTTDLVARAIRAGFCETCES